MDFIPRIAQATLNTIAKQYPAIVITGPRQSGKTTIVRQTFKDKPYVSLEDIDVREYAETDPRGFLKQYADGAIFDEVQRVPALFSYLQTIIDDNQQMGQFILTGSQQFGLISGITQSLAGRIAKVNLLPFSFRELQQEKRQPQSLTDLLYKGLYPPIYDRNLEPGIWYNNYVETYIQRDVRQLINVKDLTSFQRFLRMCAARTGQLLNLSSLANDCGISHNTAKAWISVLEASYIVYLLPPYHQNFNKRLTKAPKLYFYDTGLASWLLNIQAAEQLRTHAMRGALFETWAITEILKYRYNLALHSNLYFWRDQNGQEIDLLIDQGQQLLAMEIKSGATITKDYFKSLNQFMKLLNNQQGFTGEALLLYGGYHQQDRQDTKVLDWQSIAEIATLLNRAT